MVFLFVGHFVFDSFSYKMTNLRPYQGILIFFVFFCFQCVQTLVPIQFPSSSQHVPQIVPNRITLLSHMLQPKLNFHVYKLQKGGGGGAMGSTVIFGSFKKNCDGLLKVPPSQKEQNKLWGPPSTN